MTVEITAEAEADIEAIGDYIARDNPARAVSFIREPGRSCMELAELPKTRPIVAHCVVRGIRRRVHGRYLIFYRLDPGRVTILHILNGAMDGEGFLFPNC